MVDSGDGVHLFVLQHGLWGSCENLLALQATIEQKLEKKNKVSIINANTNTKYATYDGIDL